MKNTFLTFLTSLVVLALVSEIASAERQGPVGKVDFSDGALQINAGVERFASGLAQGLFNDFSSATVRFDRDAEGKVIDEFHKGRVSGEFYGLLPGETTSSEIISQFSVGIGVEPVDKVEYEIHVKAQGSATAPVVFLQNYLQKSLEDCGTSQDDLFSLKTFCIDFQSSNQWQGLSAPALAAEMAGSLKAGLIETISTTQDDQLNQVKDRLLSYIDERIVIESSPALTKISINFADLADTFKSEARDFLNNNGLIDYRYNRIEILVSDDELRFDFHMLKLHVAKVFKLYMLALSNMQSTMEDPVAGRGFGEDYRKGTDVITSVLKNASWADSIAGAKTIGMGALNQEPVELDLEDDELEELGLD